MTEILIQTVIEKPLDCFENFYIRNIATLYNICEWNGIELIFCIYIISGD